MHRAVSGESGALCLLYYGILSYIPGIVNSENKIFFKKTKPKSRPGIKLTFYSADFRTELLKELLQCNILFFKKVLTNNLSCGIMYRLC